MTDIDELKSCIGHDEATIRSFVRDPEYAEYYLQTVKGEGDAEEISEVQGWYDEAKVRRETEAPYMAYWDAMKGEAEETVRAGRGLKAVIEKVRLALEILRTADLARA